MQHSLARCSLPPLLLRQYRATRPDAYAARGRTAVLEFFTFVTFVGMCLGLVAEFS